MVGSMTMATGVGYLALMRLQPEIADQVWYRYRVRLRPTWLALLRQSSSDGHCLTLSMRASMAIA